MNENKSLLKALFPGSILTFLLVTCTVAVFLPLIILRLAFLIIADIVYRRQENKN